MSLTAGSRLGPYEVISAIGAGGMGEVYRARDPRLGRDVAIKVLPAGFSADVERLTRLEQEARAAAALNHPNMAVEVDREGSAFRVGAVRPLFEWRAKESQRYMYDVSADGQRFLVNTLVEQAGVEPLTLVVNWTAALKK